VIQVLESTRDLDVRDTRVRLKRIKAKK